MNEFLNSSVTEDSFWRAIILFGRNSATYKFSLAKSLLELKDNGRTHITLDELSVPFSKNILEHLEKTGKQGTSGSSSFINILKEYQTGKISKEQMLSETARRGFVNVLDAFHVVNQGEIKTQFFKKQTGKDTGIVITDEFYKMIGSIQSPNLAAEVESRWRLVETAWSMGISPKMLVVQHDQNNEQFYVVNNTHFRINVTSSIGALSGYQRGKCFYCLNEVLAASCEVDHFFPITLARHQPKEIYNLNGVWNLVLACKDCNRGSRGKWARIPELKYLERLHRRNNYLIDSHHPLRETLINQTGSEENQRAAYLRTVDLFAIQNLAYRWKPEYEFETEF